MPTPQYFLSSLSYLCPSKRHWVILDVSTDRYFAVDRNLFESLGPFLYGWRDNTTAVTHLATEARELADELLNIGVLRVTSDQSKLAQPLTLAMPLTAWGSEPIRFEPRLHIPYVTRFYIACARASYRLNKQTILACVQSVHNRRSRLSARRPFDYRKAERLTLIFKGLRLFYPRAYLCMFDSLALLEFLSIHNIFPCWVFGANSDPFEAHCWIQHESLVLNDTLQRISSYTPIMSV